MILYENIRKVALDLLIHDLDFDIPDLPLGAAVNYLRRAARQMAKDGDLARRTATIRLQPGVVVYRLTPPDQGVEVNAILRIRQGGRDVRRLTHQPEHSFWSGPFSWMAAKNEICFWNPGGRKAEVFYSVVPLPRACDIDAALAETHYEVLLAGARHFAYDAGQKPWTDPNRAAEYRRQFIQGIQAAKVEQLTGGQRGAIRPDWGHVL